VTVGGALILYATTVGLGGGFGFRRAAWPQRAPRLGAAAVLAAAWSVPLAFLLKIEPNGTVGSVPRYTFTTTFSETHLPRRRSVGR